MIDKSAEPHPPGKHRYTSVVQGVELANEFARSRLTVSEFARQRGVSAQMVRYWCGRARRLASASTQPALVQVAEVSATGAVEPVPAPAALAAPAPRAIALPAPSVDPPIIELRLPNGVRIGVGAGFSPEVLSQLIACVSGRLC